MGIIRRTLLFVFPLSSLFPSSPLAAQFTDVTTASGIGGILSAQYLAHPSWWLSGLHFVDLDGDGALDFFLSSHGGGDAVATRGDGAGHFSVFSGTWPTSEIHLHADPDGDGLADLTMTFTDGGGQWWHNVSTAGSLDFDATSETTEGNAARAQVLLDFDRDGNEDWLRSAPPGLVVELGDGQGGFGPDEITFAVPGTDSNNNANFLPGDFDGDGDTDLLVMTGGGYEDTDGRTYYLRNDGAAGLVDATASAGLPATGTVVKGVGDFDLDGDLDLVGIAARHFPPVVYRNSGGGHFTLDGAAIAGVASQSLDYSAWGTAVTADFDDDGAVDLLMNGKYFLKLLRGQGDGTFAYQNTAWGIVDTCACSVDDGLAFGDFDRDGDLDLVGYVEIFPSRTLRVYRNDVATGHWLNVRLAGWGGDRDAAGAKIRVRAPGTNDLVSFQEVAVYCFQAANSYYGYGATERHVGLGGRTAVDVEVTFAPSGRVARLHGVPADRTIVVEEPPPGAIFADGVESGGLEAWAP
ncbi:MAG: VCBS repeat-containing protein [Thermoanaerobaculia bacterium]